MKKNKTVKRRSLKGMTLMEVLIAMVVLVVMTSMVAEAGASIVTNMRTSKSVIEKVNYQSKYVAARSKDTGDDRPMNPSQDVVTFEVEDEEGNDYAFQARVFEVNPDPDALYAGYDKAGNLKYFEAENPLVP